MSDKLLTLYAEEQAKTDDLLEKTLHDIKAFLDGTMEISTLDDIVEELENWSSGRQVRDTWPPSGGGWRFFPGACPEIGKIVEIGWQSSDGKWHRAFAFYMREENWYEGHRMDYDDEYFVDPRTDEIFDEIPLAWRPVSDEPTQEEIDAAPLP